MSNQNVFDDKAEDWNSSRSLPWNRLRYEVTHALIRRHFGGERPRVLEIGCGNGYEASLWRDIASEITLSDYSGKMLETAKSLFERFDSQPKVDFIHAGVTELPERLSGQFDLILFHNIIEYVQEPVSSLRSIKRLLTANGMLSVRHLNRHSNPLIPAMYENDLQTAFDYLTSPTIKTSFGTEVTTFTRSQMSDYLKESGYEVTQFYGVMSLTGYMTDNQKKSDPEFYGRLKEIELKMADMFPYYEIARFGLFFAKHQAAG